MSNFTNQIVDVCNAELARFEFGQKTELDDPQFRFVGEYWQSIDKSLDGRTVVGGIRPAWSSAFVSFCIRRAGADNRFRYTEAHCHYVAEAMKQADGTNPNFGWRARRQAEYAPRVGDIIVAGREYARSFDFDRAKLVYTADSFYPSHGDIVVGVEPGKVTTIGGNVSTDTVGRRMRATNGDGTLKNTTVMKNGNVLSYPWIAVLECLL